MRRGYPAALLLLTAVLLTANGQLLAGDAVPLWDAASFYAPAQILLADHARAGRFLLWNPWTSGGRPDGADPQVGAFSPLNVGLGLVTGGRLEGFVLYWLVTWWLGGVGVLALARELRAPAWAAGVAALAYVASGFFIGHATHTSFVVAASLLPWIVWRFDVALRRRSKLAAAQAGVLWGLSALAGYPALVILTGFYVGLWSLGRALISTSEPPDDPPDRRLDLRQRAFAMVAAWGVFLLIGALVLAPAYAAFFVEGRGFTDRVEPLTKELAVHNNALHPGALATFASPYLAVVKLAHRELWSYSDPSMASIHVSLVALGLALAALVNRPREPWRWWVLGLAAFFLMAAMGQALPVRGWLYDLFVPMRFFRHSAIFRLFYVFSMVVLALYAGRDLATPDQRLARRRWLHLACVVLGLAPVGLAAVGLTVSQLPQTGRAFPYAMAWAGFVGIGACAAAFLSAARGRAARRGVPALLALLCAADAAASLRLSHWFIQSDRPAEWRQAIAAYSPKLDLTPGGLDRRRGSTSVAERNNRNLLTKEPTLAGVEDLSNFYHSRWISSPVLAAAVTGSDRIWFSPDAIEIEPSPETFELFRQRAEALGAPPLVIHRRHGTTVSRRPAPAAALGELEAMTRLPVELEAYHPNRLSFSFTSPGDGWLLVTDRYAPGWRLWVDGRESELHRANFIYRAVRVGRGRHQLTMRYRPYGFPHLLIASWTVMGGVAVASLRRRRASSRKPNGEPLEA